MTLNNKKSKFCPTCGGKNDLNANFCDKCGTKLLKPYLKSKSDDPFNLFRNFINNNKLLVILISSLIVLTLMANYISGMTPLSQGNKIVPYGNDTGTFYDSEYLSFSHNKMYEISIGNKNDPPTDGSIFNGWADPQEIKTYNGQKIGTNYAFQITVYKPINATQSAYEYAVSDKNANENINVTTYPLNSIQIAGVAGYEYYTVYVTADGSKTKVRNIFFVKNGLLYKIEFNLLQNFENYQKEMDTVTNSFTIK